MWLGWGVGSESTASSGRTIGGDRVRKKSVRKRIGEKGEGRWERGKGRREWRENWGKEEGSLRRERREVSEEKEEGQRDRTEGRREWRRKRSEGKSQAGRWKKKGR